MKIVEESAERLVIEDRPWVFGILLIACVVSGLLVAWREGLAEGDWAVAAAGGVFAAGALGGLVTGIRRARLTLTAEGAELVTRGFRGTARRRLPAEGLRAAIETHRDTDGETERVVLLSDGGGGIERVPLTPYFSGGDGPRAISDRINAWAARA